MLATHRRRSAHFPQLCDDIDLRQSLFAVPCSAGSSQNAVLMPLLPSAVLGIQHPHRWQGDKELFEELAGSALAVEEGWATVQPSRNVRANSC